MFHEVSFFFCTSKKTLRLLSSLSGWDLAGAVHGLETPADLQRCEQHSLLTQTLMRQVLTWVLADQWISLGEAILVITARLEIRGEPQGCSNLLQFDLQLAKYSFAGVNSGLLQADSAWLCINLSHKNNVLVKLNHEDTILLTYKTKFPYLLSQDEYFKC